MPTHREHDERVLAMLRHQDKGHTSRETAEHFGITAAGVRGMLGRIRRAMAKDDQGAE